MTSSLFFFQAEDGIRDIGVTGVQTCALPICYAREPERVRIHSLQATFHGGHDDHSVELSEGHWRCSCHAFSTHVLGTCAHVMAIQQMMSPMLSEDDRYSGDEFAVTAEALPIAN